MSQSKQTHQQVQEYYGEVLSGSDDLKTSACCMAEAPPEYVRDTLAKIHPDVLDKFYGCGSPLPPALKGKTVLDLGCGTGRDCYVLSQLVGASGQVIGVDMTPKQLEMARKYIDYHMEQFGFKQPNVAFRQALIEDLSQADIADNSIDVVVSNCVLNLAPEKASVFREIFRVLKPGGELYFSDVFSSRRIPESLTQDPVLRGECLGGALYIEDFRRLLAEMGCRDYRVMNAEKITLTDSEVEAKAGMIPFYSMTIRAFKLPVEDRCEDYGQAAEYLGGMDEFPQAFRLDDHHLFEKGQLVAVCRNTAQMLSDTRFAPYFKVYGEASTHYGLFDCGDGDLAGVADSQTQLGACC